MIKEIVSYLLSFPLSRRIFHRAEFRKKIVQSNFSGVSSMRVIKLN
jgi:hypothetical protein